MIIGSIALVVVSAALWGIGLWENSDLWYYASIVGSVLATFALIVGVRQRSRARMPEDDFDLDPLHRAVPVPPTPRPTGRAAVPRGSAPAAAGASTVTRQRQPDEAVTATGEADPTDPSETEPPDEPPAEVLTDKQAQRIATMTADVVVIDGRPRFHEAGCLQLLGRDSERLPVNEAVQLGFTPCSQCEPARGLLATRPRS